MNRGSPAPEDGPAATADRDEAVRYAVSTRRFLERRGRRVPEAARAEALAAAAALEAAAGGGDAELLAEANARLDAVWRDHLAFVARKGALRELVESALLALVAALFLRAFVVEAFKIPSSSMVPTVQVGDHLLVSKLSYGLRVPFVNRFLLRWSEPRRGDVVVFANPLEPGKDYIKRVIGLPGDVVELRDQAVYVNGVPQPREAAAELTYDEQAEGGGRWWTESCPAWRETLARGRIDPPRSAMVAALGDAFAGAAGSGTVTHLVAQCRRARLGEREGPFERVAPGHVFVLGDNRDRSADSRSGGGWQVPLSNVKGRATFVFWSWGRSGWTPWGGAAGLRVERLFKRIE
ncbi:MAG TPA: signal peptidase I [Anaeromyxobacteraceae bacterium]